MEFFDTEASIFLRNQTASNFADRLNKRFQVIFETYPRMWRGKRVLDLGSHDGRWSYAALAMGAHHVTGLEGRPYLVNVAHQSFNQLDVPRAKYRFITTDALDYMEKTTETFDIVLCLGFFYHVYDHVRLVRLMHKMNPQYIMLDTHVVRNTALRNTASRKCITWVRRENVSRKGNAIETQPALDERNYVAIPSRPLLRQFMGQIGFGFKVLDWQRFKDDPTNIDGYISGDRITAFCKRKSLTDAKTELIRQNTVTTIGGKR